LRRARAFGAPRTLGIALRTAGLVEGGDPGLERLAEAVTVLNRSEAVLELARALIDYGSALRRFGRRRDAREPLRRGLDAASRCGAVVLAQRAREELLAAGARPRRERISGAAALTASELRVARLAAEGLTKRQIAQALFVSMSTVSTHLGHVYAKLDINDRRQLASALIGDATPAA
jgi:DNA-binding CsgD family transcriptional regulator